jgi:hypothetical protein
LVSFRLDDPLDLNTADRAGMSSYVTNLGSRNIQGRKSAYLPANTAHVQHLGAIVDY